MLKVAFLQTENDTIIKGLLQPLCPVGIRKYLLVNLLEEKFDSKLIDSLGRQ